MTDWWDSLRRDVAQEVRYIGDLWRDIARDDRQTRSQLALLRNGHPKARETPRSEETDYSDPTGEFGVTPDYAAVMQGNYAEALARVAAYLEAADAIRRRMEPIAVKPNDVADPDDWCPNCLEAQVCNPVRPNYRYCWWCIAIRQEYKWLPPTHIVKLRHEQGNGPVVTKALTEHKQQRKKRNSAR